MEIVSSTDMGWTPVVSVMSRWLYCWEYSQLHEMVMLTMTKIPAHAMPAWYSSPVSFYSQEIKIKICFRQGAAY
jgi:hypothetical protein